MREDAHYEKYGFDLYYLYRVSYDNKGRISELIETKVWSESRKDTATVTFSYDDKDRILEVHVEDDADEDCTLIEYEYDSKGNEIKVKKTKNGEVTVTENQYDGNGACVRTTVTDGDGNVISDTVHENFIYFCNMLPKHDVVSKFNDAVTYLYN